MTTNTIFKCVTLASLRAAWIAHCTKQHRAYINGGHISQTTLDQWATVFDQWAERHGLTEEAAA